MYDCNAINRHQKVDEDRNNFWAPFSLKSKLLLTSLAVNSAIKCSFYWSFLTLFVTQKSHVIFKQRSELGINHRDSQKAVVRMMQLNGNCAVCICSHWLEYSTPSRSSLLPLCSVWYYLPDNYTLFLCVISSTMYALCCMYALCALMFLYTNVLW